MDDLRRLAIARDAAREAGRLILSLERPEVRVKAAHDYVTDADAASEALLRRALLGACPEDAFYGEESGESGRAGGGRWIVDPIDGTTNFIHGIPQFAVSVAYEDARGLRLGVVYNPALDELYEAAVGHGAARNGAPIRVSRVTNPIDAVACMSFAHRNEACRARMLSLLPALTRGLNDLRRLGSAALDLCYVACGRVDAFFELDLHIYDIAAGLVILREAGGVATGWPGGANCEESGDVLATNGLIHAWLETTLGDGGNEK